MFYQITFSPTGGTKKATGLLGAAWEEEKTEIDLCGRKTDFSRYCFSAADICLIGVPSFGGRVPAVAAERLGQMRGGGAKAILAVVYGNRAYEDTLLELKDILAERGFRIQAAAALVAEHSILREFAAGRPDHSDEREIRAFSEKIKARWQEEHALLLPGNRPYREYGTIPMTPKGGKECGGCGICAEKCPVGAIPPENPRETDGKRCISCMACIAVCPQKARAVSPLLLAGARLKLKKALAGRKENELFL